ncbi:MAG: DUF222 domain-containing protein [Actinomycetota bacterium]|nr:DUF222 domain-containing protein [Actinomycetota bacterium]
MLSLLDRARGLREVLRGLEADEVEAAAATVVVAELAALEKACAAAKVRIAARSSDVAQPAEAAERLAKASGSSIADARAALETTATLDTCPTTRRAVASGELSLRQAHEIVRTEAERPGSEAELLAVARRSGLRTLQDRGRRRRHEAIPAEELHERRHAARRHRWWVNDLGNVAYRGELPPEVGLPIMNRLDAETDRIRRDAKRAAGDTGGPVERREAHAADAFVRLCADGGRGRAGRADLVAVVDLRAYRRGHARPGEACHLLGGGRVPVDVVRRLSKDAFIKAVVHDGVRIHTVKHFGRHLSAELRTALEVGAPPDFDGAACVDCGRRYGLQWDHVDPVANRGPTSFANLEARCWPDHRAKTERDRRAGLLGRRAQKAGARPGTSGGNDDEPP